MEDEDLSPTRALLDALEDHADPAAVAAALAAAPEPLTVRYRKVITDYEAEVLDRHADALALLEALYMACWVVGTLFDEEQRPAAEAADDSRVYVLRQLWARSLQTGGEVLALLRFGYPDGALARWRQLHEVEVIVRLLADGSPELADAYVEHTRLQSVRWLTTTSAGPRLSAKSRSAAQEGGNGTARPRRAARVEGQLRLGASGAAAQPTLVRRRARCAAPSRRADVRGPGAGRRDAGGPAVDGGRQPERPPDLAGGR